MGKKATKKAKRQYLGSGFIWFFGDHGRPGYAKVGLTTERDGRGQAVTLRTGKLGGWLKVRLYAEYEDKP